MKDRIFVGVYPTGIVFADKSRAEYGDYKRVAFWLFSTMTFHWFENPEPKVRIYIESHVDSLKPGQEFEVSACGQTVTLGTHKQ